MNYTIKLKEKFSVKPETLYNAWLDSKTHSAMTGGKAACSDMVKGRFTAWDGYISGTNETLVPNKEIVQTWRTTEFKETDKDSRLSIYIEEIENGSLLTLIHTNIPEGQSDYENGWIEHYFSPMKKYFGTE
ncbi:MAG: SRPBCC domain-containing protein [Maribacter sp.]|nr:SRPBCC domain-containing protein [Maribacter sp.]